MSKNRQALNNRLWFLMAALAFSLSSVPGLNIEFSNRDLASRGDDSYDGDSESLRDKLTGLNNQDRIGFVDERSDSEFGQETTEINVERTNERGGGDEIRPVKKDANDPPEEFYRITSTTKYSSDGVKNFESAEGDMKVRIVPAKQITTFSQLAKAVEGVKKDSRISARNKAAKQEAAAKAEEACETDGGVALAKDKDGNVRMSDKVKCQLKRLAGKSKEDAQEYFDSNVRSNLQEMLNSDKKTDRMAALTMMQQIWRQLPQDEDFRKDFQALYKVGKEQEALIRLSKQAGTKEARLEAAKQLRDFRAQNSAYLHGEDSSSVMSNLSGDMKTYQERLEEISARHQEALMKTYGGEASSVRGRRGDGYDTGVGRTSRGAPAMTQPFPNGAFENQGGNANSASRVISRPVYGSPVNSRQAGGAPNTIPAGGNRPARAF